MQRRMISVDNFFRIFEIIIFCSVVAKSDLVYDVETIFDISYVLTICSFKGITHILEKTSKCC